MIKKCMIHLSLILAIMVLGSSFALAEWCGENGLVRLSFTAGPELQPVNNIEASSKGITMIDLYAFITDMDPIKRDGEAFLGIGALELSLVVEGAEAFITSQEFPVANRTVGRRPGEVIVGLDPGIILEKDHTQLVHWQVMFQGTPKNVVFRLDPDGGISCKRTPGCEEARPYALYTGTNASRQISSIFGAGCVPAYLNFEGEADLKPQRGKQTWQDVGIYDKR